MATITTVYTILACVYEIWPIINQLTWPFNLWPQGQSSKADMYVLTHCGLVMPYGDIDWVNIGLGNGLVPSGNKPLPKPMLTWTSIT